MKTTTILLGFLFILQTATAQDDFWEHLNTPDDVGFWDVEHVIGDIIVASSGPGLFISYDNGDTWDTTSFKFECKDIEAGPNGYVYVHKMLWNQFWYSPDTCKTWIKVDYDFGIGPFVMTIHADDDNTVFVGTDFRVFRSQDTCKTWEEVLYNPASPWVRDINRNPVTGKIYAAYGSPYDYFEGLWGSPTGDSGTWETKNMLHDNAACISFDKQGEIYVGVAHNIHTGFNGVYKSSGNDSTWEQFFWNYEVNGIVATQENDLYVACARSGGGLFLKAQNDSVFRQIDSTPPLNYPWCLKLINNHLFAIDEVYANIYRTTEPVSTFGIKEYKTSGNISVYPNPVSKGQKLNIIIPGAGTSINQIILYNLHGKKVKTMGSDYGSNTISIPTSGLQPGVYIMKIMKGGVKYTRKIIIAR